MTNNQSAIRLVVVASRNKGKIREISHYLDDYSIRLIPQPKEIIVEETGKTFIENARLKALEVSYSTGEWALADDSGLCVHSLGGAPGVKSARYAKTDEKRIKRLLNELEDTLDRSAYFCSALCLASANGEILLEVEGYCSGSIVNEPRGVEGFGYDPVFEESSTGLTFAEMSISQKRKLGHRGKAFSLLEKSLRTLLKN